MTFEDKFMDIQANMISLSLEYVENQADKIYIYCISEKDLIKFDLFYKILNKYVQIHQVNKIDSIKKVDDSREMQRALLTFGNQAIEELIALCKEYGREHPTEMWLIYDVKKNSLDAQYSYEARYEKDDELLLSTNKEFEKWFEEIKENDL